MMYLMILLHEGYYINIINEWIKENNNLNLNIIKEIEQLDLLIQEELFNLLINIISVNFCY